MKARINGVEVEGTPEEIVLLIRGVGVIGASPGCQPREMIGGSTTSD